MQTPLLKSIACAFIGFTAWTLGDSAVRGLEHYPAVLVAFCSSSLALSMLLVLAPRLGGFKRSFAMPRMKLQIFRGILICIANFLSFVAFMNLDLATAYALIFSAPFLAKIISTLLTKEQISLYAWLTTLIGFVGVLIVLRPGLIPLNIGTMSAVGLAFFFSLGQVMGRYIGEDNQTPFAMSFFPYVFMVLGTAWPALSILQSGIVIEPDFALIVCKAVMGLTGMICVSYAFAHAPTAYIAPIHYVQILWGVLWGVLFFGEFPDLWTLIGGSVIILAGLLLIFQTRKTNTAIASGGTDR